MKNIENITNDDIKRVCNMSEKEIEQRLSAMDSKAIKNIVGNLSGSDIKKQLSSKSPEEISKLLNGIGKLNPSLLKKIKDAIK